MKGNMTGPRMTFALMGYNIEAFIEEAISGALSQTYEPTEIILSDDCSADATYRIMEEMAAGYRGPHKVVLNRNPCNVGVGGHINRIMELCTGEVVVIAAGDDVSLPNRVEKICEAYLESQRQALSLCSSCVLIDEAGAELRHIPVMEDETTLESMIANGSYVYGCTHAWHRSVFDMFGPLPLEIGQEDEVIPFRSLLLGKISRIGDTLVRYRMHANNLSSEYKYVAKDEKELQELDAIKFGLKLNKLKCYYRDLEVARDHVEKNRLNRLRKRLAEMISECELEIAFRTANIPEKLRVLRRGIIRGLGTGKLTKWTLRTVLPRLYSRYSYYRYRKRLKPDLLLAKETGGQVFQ
jgi:glycosyltransferase involved in cell wall biosynthesis